MQILINTKVLAMAGVKTLLLLLLRLAGGLILLLLSGYILADSLHAQAIAAAPDAKIDRSEERRVGKECRSRWSPYH